MIRSLFIACVVFVSLVFSSFAVPRPVEAGHSVCYYIQANKPYYSQVQNLTVVGSGNWNCGNDWNVAQSARVRLWYACSGCAWTVVAEASYNGYDPQHALFPKFTGCQATYPVPGYMSSIDFWRGNHYVQAWSSVFYAGVRRC